MAAFNKTGFYLDPSLDETIKAVKKPGMNFIPMSVLAAGAIHPEDAFSFISQFPEI